MSFSIGPFIMCLLVSACLIAYANYILKYTKMKSIRSMKIIFWGICIILLRMVLPINFPFTITIDSKEILAPIVYVLGYPISGFYVMDWILIIWASVSIICFIHFINTNYKFRKLIMRYVTENADIQQMIDTISDKREHRRIKFSIVPINISPAIIGIVHPVLIIPEYVLQDEDRYDIILHELEHYYNRDLLLKFEIEVVACIQWWNPFIYIVREKSLLIMELSNDLKVIEEKTIEERLQYAECIVRTSILLKEEKRKCDCVNAVAFTDRRDAHLKSRMNLILEEDSKVNDFIMLRHIALIVIMVIISYVFVFEGSVEPPASEHTMTIEPDNSYFLETKDGFNLYVNDKYTASFEEIPDEFTSLPIK